MHTVKDWFKKGGKGRGSKPGYSVDDLIVLERYDEAESALRAELKRSPKDLRRRLQLGSVLTNLQRVDEALIEFFYVADAYNADGFQDKAIALLSSAKRLSPDNPDLLARIQRSLQDKELARMRSIAVEALKEASRTETGRVATAAIELEQIWDRLSKTQFVRGLPLEQVKHLFANMRIQRLRPDQVLAEGGAAGTSLFLFSGGEIEAQIDSPNGVLTVRTFGAGDIVGDTVLLKRTSWPARLLVTKVASALELDREGLERAMQGNPDPKGLLDLLRSQGNDVALAQAVTKLG